MKKKTLIYLLILITALLAIFLAGCEGSFEADGKVYEWVDAPVGSRGEIYIDTDAPANRIKTPVPDARIFFRTPPVTSDKTGAFHDFKLVAPGGPYMMDIEVEKEGYFPLTGRFQHESGGEHTVTIFIVRK